MAENNDEIIIVDYREEWPELFQTEKQLVAEALGDTIAGIEHVGSTAVPGLSAKPIIDILVLVEKLESGWFYAGKLEKLDYLYWDNPDRPDHYFLKKGSPRTHHIHIMVSNSVEHLRYVAFREYLRTHPETIADYEQLKKELAEKFRDDREAYTEAKTEFIKSIEIKAQRGDYAKRKL